MAEGLQLTIMLADTLCEGAAIVSKMGSRAGRSASGEDVLRRSLVEALRRTLGQAMSERLESPPNGVNELPTRAYQRLTRADDRQVSLGVLTAVFERVE